MLVVGEHVLGHLEPQCARMATPLCAGVGGTRLELCGALNGGLLIIGGLYGRTSLDQDDQLALDLATRLRERFLAEFGTTTCAPLREKVQAPGGLGSCAAVVERAAMMLLELLAEAEA